MDQDETWHTGRPRPRRYCVRWEPSSPHPKGYSPPIFGPYLLWPNACMDQDATWYGGRSRPRQLCVRWGPRSPSQKGGGAPSPISAHLYCGQTARWIKMSLCMDVGLSTGNFVLDGDSVHLPQKGAEPPNFRPLFIVVKQLNVEDATWHRGRPQPRRLCVRWGPSSPVPKKGAESRPQVSAHFYCGQTAECIKMPLGIEVGISPGDFMLDGDPAPLQKGGGAPQFSAHVYCGQMAGWIKMALGMAVVLGPGHIVLDEDPAPLPKRGQSPHFWPIFIVQLLCCDCGAVVF